MIIETVTAFVAGLAGDTMIDFVKDQLKNPIQKKLDAFKATMSKHELPVNHDIQKAIRKSFLHAGAEAAQWWRRIDPPSSKPNTDEFWNHEAVQRTIAAFFDDELFKFRDPNYLPVDIVMEKPILLNMAEFYNDNAKSQIQQLKIDLSSILITELQEHLNRLPTRHLIPKEFEQIILDGWSEGERTWDVYTVMCDYFREMVKTEERLRSILLTQWLADTKFQIEELEAHLSVLGRNFIDTYGKLPRYFETILNKLNPQPLLRMNFEVSEYSEITFRARFVPLLGRDMEIQKLMLFWQAEVNFGWSLITGAAGTGKSRLSLEFCKHITNQQTVFAGFINLDQLASFNWYNWEPTCPTLIIIDYTAFVENQVINTLKIIKDRNEDKQLKYPVKFLLLERSFSGSWSNHFIRSISTGDIPDFFEGTPIELSELNVDQVNEIYNYVLNQKGKSFLWHSWSKFKIDYSDRLKRPLFAIILALAVAESEYIKDWEIENVLGNLLNRYLEKIWLPAAARDELVLNEHLNLLAIATMAGGLNQTELDSILDLELKWLPNDRLNLKLYQLIAPSSNDNIICAGLEPDILGEYFVRSQLNHTGNFPRLEKDKQLRAISIAWQISPLAMGRFIFRMFEDFAFRRNGTPNLLSIFQFLEIQLKNLSNERVEWYIEILNAVILIAKTDEISGFDDFLEAKLNLLLANFDFKELDLAYANFLNRKLIGCVMESTEDLEGILNQLENLYQSKSHSELVPVIAQALITLTYFVIESETPDKADSYYAKMNRLVKENQTNELLEIKMVLLSALIQGGGTKEKTIKQLLEEANELYLSIESEKARYFLIQCKYHFIQKMGPNDSVLSLFEEIQNEVSEEHFSNLLLIKAEVLNQFLPFLIKENLGKANQLYVDISNNIGFINDHNVFINTITRMVEIAGQFLASYINDTEEKWMPFLNDMLQWCKVGQWDYMAKKIGEQLFNIINENSPLNDKLKFILTNFLNLEKYSTDKFKFGILKAALNVTNGWSEVKQLDPIVFFKDRIINIANTLSPEDSAYVISMLYLDIIYLLRFSEDEISFLNHHKEVLELAERTKAPNVIEHATISYHYLIDHFLHQNNYNAVETYFEEFINTKIFTSQPFFTKSYLRLIRSIYIDFAEKNNFLTLENWNLKVVSLTDFYADANGLGDYAHTLMYAIEILIDKGHHDNVLNIYESLDKLVELHPNIMLFSIQGSVITKIVSSMGRDGLVVIDKTESLIDTFTRILAKARTPVNVEHYAKSLFNYIIILLGYGFYQKAIDTFDAFNKYDVFTSEELTVQYYIAGSAFNIIHNCIRLKIEGNLSPVIELFLVQMNALDHYEELQENEFFKSMDNLRLFLLKNQ